MTKIFDKFCSQRQITKATKSLKQITPPPLPKLPPPLIQRRYPKNFRALSANVQRLISHSNTSLHPDDMSENQANDLSNDTNCNYDRKRFTASPIIAQSNTNCSKFKHPLSKNTCKLTQSGNDLVIDDSDGGYETPSEISYSTIDSEYKNIENGNSNHNYDDLEDSVEEKTPTNEYPSMQFDENVYEEINCNQGCSEYNEKGKDDILINEENGNASETTINQNSEGTDATASIELKTQKSFLHSISPKCETNEQRSSSSIQHSPTLSQKSTGSDTKSTKSQLFAIKAQVNEENTKNAIVGNNSPINDTTNTNILNNDSNGNPITETHSNTKSISNKENNEHSIGLKRNKKIRPLSSVSISSTSSSSSSASDEHSSNQNVISYLASVESLADHSENELSALTTNLTVTERVCLEIFDSERSYVDDLGQVIRG